MKAMKFMVVEFHKLPIQENKQTRKYYALLELLIKIYEHDKVHSLVDYEVRVKGDGTDVVEKSFVYPKSMDIKRLDIRYAEDGGAEKRWSHRT